MQLLVTLAPSLMPMIEKQDTVTVPGLHVKPAAPPAPVPSQLTDGVASVKPAPDSAREEEIEVPAKPAKPTKPAAEAVPVKPARPAADATPAHTPQHKLAAPKPAKPRPVASDQPKAEPAPRPKPAAVEEVLH